MLTNVVVTLACLLPSLVVGYPSGAPLGACESMTPKHGVNGQASSAPYHIRVPQLSVQGGETVQVTIMPTTTGGYFKGFFIQARAAYTGDIIDGEFEKTNPADAIKTRDCNGGYNNSMTHADRSVKTKVTLEWTAPWYLSGDVEFVATVVKDGHTWWSHVKSDMLSSSTEVSNAAAKSKSGPFLMLILGCVLAVGTRFL